MPRMVQGSARKADVIGPILQVKGDKFDLATVEHFYDDARDAGLLT